MISENIQDNPFFAPFDTPFGAIPFDKIKLCHYEPALLEAMRREDEEIGHIVHNPAEPTFDNTIVALEGSGEMLERVTSVFFNLQSANTCDELDALSERMAPLLSKHANDIMLSEELFARVKAVHDSAPKLEGEEAKLMEDTYDSFVRHGALLDKEGKATLRSLSEEASLLSLKFQQNNLKETNAHYLHLTKEEDLSGLPPMQKEQALMTAKEKGLDGWVITLHGPSYAPFLTYADNRPLRERLYLMQNTKCTHADEWDNFKIVQRLVNIRRELSRLLGFDTYADYVLQRRMAGNVATVRNLLRSLMEAYKEPAEKEVAEVQEKARRMGLEEPLQPWDYAYYSHKLQLEKYDLDAEMLRPYFELSKVKSGVFGLATKLYGITFHENKDLPVYHPDVCAYEVREADGRFLALLYMDFHPREGKQSGAWETSYRGQWIDKDGVNHRPVASVTMNFTKPTPTKPALLTLGEVSTLLHEFGHALHSMMADTRFASLSGTSVYWDFVELPSQFMENYAIERDFLSTFARHYETGEPLPDELLERIRKSRNFGVAYACMRQVSFCLLDMAYHTLAAPFEEDVRAFEKRAWKEAVMLPQREETCMSVQFGHIMSGGYAAGYYSYKWAEVLEADAFSLFKKQGIFSKETARSFRDNILSRGGTEHPMTLYRRFRGQEPTIEALLERNGIIPSQN